ncbi:hypothetical protein A0H81_03183 [Grifola frondosa]|uniref:Uncharacterized protein n=1 Tax=Grifola frondosa TaxID=5627 RepID=A0A1C7MHD4_GRIFR|nr:hypothetical protein A0H81_03183 [Grifola frondosa]
MQAFAALRIFLLFGTALFSVVAALPNYSARAQDVPSSDAGAVVNLRIEGANNTIFEGPIFTRGHNVTTVSGGTHHCDGTNLNANLTPGPTCTSALDDASKLARFTWDGTFDPTFDDFFITRIASSAETTTQFWGLLLNFQFTPVGGCQQEVQRGDRVLWAFDAFNKAHFLSLSGPSSVRVGERITLTVTDGMSGTAIEGAQVVETGDGPGASLEELSDANGEVSFTFTSPGTRAFKAGREDSLRSNAVEILVLL